AHSLLSDTVRAPRRPALFPYTTLFRSLRAVLEGVLHGARQQGPGDTAFAIADPDGEAHHRPGGRPALRLTAGQGAGILQSRDQRLGGEAEPAGHLTVQIRQHPGGGLGFGEPPEVSGPVPVRLGWPPRQAVAAFPS